eukprot:397799-Pyramimonas_sp.AAC.1
MTLASALGRPLARAPDPLRGPLRQEGQETLRDPLGGTPTPTEKGKGFRFLHPTAAFARLQVAGMTPDARSCRALLAAAAAADQVSRFAAARTCFAELNGAGRGPIGREQLSAAATAAWTARELEGALRWVQRAGERQGEWQGDRK